MATETEREERHNDLAQEFLQELRRIRIALETLPAIEKDLQAIAGSQTRLPAVTGKIFLGTAVSQ